MAAATPVAKSREDQELTELLAKLYGIQEDIGAKPKTTEEEKKEKATNVAVMGMSSSLRSIRESIVALVSLRQRLRPPWPLSFRPPTCRRFCLFSLHARLAELRETLAHCQSF
jgi:hypothetical protein